MRKNILEKIIEQDDELSSKVGSIIRYVDGMKADLVLFQEMRQAMRKDNWLKIENLIEAVWLLKKEMMKLEIGILDNLLTDGIRNAIYLVLSSLDDFEGKHLKAE